MLLGLRTTSYPAPDLAASRAFFTDVLENPHVAAGRSTRPGRVASPPARSGGSAPR